MTKHQLPTTADFSNKAIARYVAYRVRNSPLTLYPIVGGVSVGAVSLAWFGEPSLLAMLATLIGVGFGIVNLWLDLAHRKDKFALEYLEAYNRLLESRSEELADYLASEFRNLEDERGVEMLTRLRKHFKTLERVLGEKFDVNDITYKQFHGTAEALYLETLNLLKGMLSHLRVIRAFDLEYLKHTGGNANTDEKRSIEERKRLHEEANERYNALVASIEASITALATLSSEVASIGADEHDIFVRRALELSEKAGKYVDEKRV